MDGIYQPESDKNGNGFFGCDKRFTKIFAPIIETGESGKVFTAKWKQGVWLFTENKNPFSDVRE